MKSVNNTSMFKEHKPKPFDVKDTDNIAISLDRDGYAVVRVDSVELDELKSLFSKDIGEITGKHVKFPELWDSSNPIPSSGHPGLMGEYGLSQGDAAWYVRTNQDIIGLYKKLLGTDDVVCSMDAIGFSQDGAYLNASDTMWLHVDQNPFILPGGNLDSIQGIFYAEDSYGERAGTVVVPGSQNRWLSHTYRNKVHYQIVNQIRYGPDAVKLDIDAGCLLLFNSRLIHQGMYGPHRLCFMICYGKKEDRNEEARKSKVVMYLGGHRSNHWSQFGMYHGWKWEHGESWNVLNPRTIVDYEDQPNMLEDEPTDPAIYESEMDLSIPKDRLALL